MTWSEYSLRILLVGLLLACLLSFAWAMRSFFRKPSGTTAGMQVVKISGLLCAILHCVAILAAGHIPLERGAVAAALYLASLGLFWSTIRASSAASLSAIFSPDLPQRLVESGPYRFVRHPFYCSYLTAWVAGFVASAEIWLVPTILAMLLIYFAAARNEEEKFAKSPLAAAYRSYRSRTGLLTPNPFKLFMGRRLEMRNQ